jgi:hypothetical protein
MQPSVVQSSAFAHEAPIPPDEAALIMHKSKTMRKTKLAMMSKLWV